MNNFLPLDRKIMKHWLWEDKPFSKGQAWIDLLMLANYTERKKPQNGEIIVYKRGSVNLSMKQLSERWGWDRRTVKRFLSLLESDDMVSVDSTTHGTTITLVNYEVFNNPCTTNCTTDGTTNAHQYVLPIVQQMPTTNKDNNIKKDEEKRKQKKEIADAFFDKLWKLYPIKKGKGSVSDTQKERLLKIGYEELARAISRYKNYVDSVDYLNYKNGSTFFNSGYVDYLDDNYEEGIELGRINENAEIPERDPYAEEFERLLSQ